VSAPRPSPNAYRQSSASTLRDTPEVRTSVGSATRTFDAKRTVAFAEIDSDRWRDWARDVKSHVLTNLDRYLETAERRLADNGVHVHWAETAADANAVLTEVVKRHGVAIAVKGKSMLTEELHVNAHLEEIGVRVRETDLGEYIIQLLDEPPSHIVGPAIHRSLDDCRRLFHGWLGTPLDAEPDALARAARDALRAEFLAADLGISGGNFLAADTGTVALIENEGNIRLSTSLPRVHVAFVGIEKIVPTLEDVSGFLQITARAATGQPIGNFVSLLQGPRRRDEVDAAWEALRCVRCGACLNICPVYRQTGGHAYGWTYSGPIGAIIAPAMLGLEESMPLPFASSLCGACADVCPVRIPIPELLVHWRERAVEAGLAPAAESAGIQAFTALAERPELYGAASNLLRWTPWRLGGRALPVLGGWMQERDAPEPSPRGFRDLWKDGIE
jgi:L-lactate dehydrogenase complex protein LldF